MTAFVSNRDLSDLIGRIYDCALDPSGWETMLDALRRIVRCRSAQLALVDRRQHRVLIQKTLGIEAHWLLLQAKYLAEITAFTERHLDSGISMDEPLVTSRLASAARYEASPYFREWGRPQGYVDVAQINIIRTPVRLSALGFGRHESQGVIEERDIEIMRLLVPHIRRAVTISNVLDAQAIEKAHMADALDALKVGVVLASEESRILHCNRAAQTMMRDGPLRDRGGILRVERAVASAEIKAAIGLAARNESGIGKTGLAVRLNDEDAAPMVAHVLPLTGGEMRTRLDPASVAAVFINPQLDDAACAKAVSMAFGLTPAETRVLSRMLAGRTVAEVAVDLDIAATTARTHLYRIFAKTGVSRQSDLIRLAAQVAPAGDRSEQ